MVLAGRGGALDSPKKSSPSNESLVLVDLGGAGSALGGSLASGGPVVLDRTGIGSSPPIRSATGGGRFRGRWDCPMDAFRIVSFLSTTCFSFTMLSGTSSSPAVSRVAGSGIGPSMTQRFSSYFVRIKFSILVSEGAWPAASLASQYLLARALPQLRTLCSCSSVHESRSTDLTLLMCVPMPRWMPEHLMHMKMPKFQLAHLGSRTAREC